MARTSEIIEHFVDDLDGSDAAETVTFTFDGAPYEIDLNKRNAKALRTDFGAWTTHARRVRGRAGSRTTRASGKAGAKPGRRSRDATSTPAVSESATIREWAAAQGVAVSSRGRIPAAIVEQYRAAS